MTTTTVVDVPEVSRYELRVDGALAGFVQYETDDDHLDLIHTEIEPAFEGQGLGSVLAAGVLDDLRRRDRKATLTCPFFARWVKRHPDYQDVVAQAEH